MHAELWKLTASKLAAIPAGFDVHGREEHARVGRASEPLHPAFSP